MKKKKLSQEKVKYIYILSQRYSGSTLLSFLLATDPNISTIGERRKFYNKSIRSNDFQHHRAKICSCGAQFDQCDYFNEIKKQVLAQTNQKVLSTNATEFHLVNNKYLNRGAYELLKFYQFYKIPLILYPFKKKLDELCAFNELLLNKILEFDKSTVFLDSSKVINHVLFLAQMKSLDLHVVWLVRDPRAQVNSALKYNETWDTESAAIYWKQEMVENEQMLRKLGVKCISLRYEDLCKSPKVEIEKIYDFVGMDARQFSIDFRSKKQHIIGNGNMRLGKEEKIVERKEWQQELSKDQVSLIESLTSEFQDFYSTQVN